MYKFYIIKGGTILLNGAKEDIKIDHKNIVFLEDLTADQKAALLKEKAGVYIYIKHKDNFTYWIRKFRKYMLFEFINSNFEKSK